MTQWKQPLSTRRALRDATPKLVFQLPGRLSMDTALLKHLGVHEKIVQALEKSSGEKIEELEIEQSVSGLKLILRYRLESGIKTHIITLNHPEEKKALISAETPQEDYAAGTGAYRCGDRILFLEPDRAGVNLILNGHKLRLSDSLFRLLLYLAHEMKKTGKGWVSIQDLREGRLIPSDGYQPFSRLRGVVAGYLIKKNPRDFLEANGCKQYRISVPPAHIMLPEEINTNGMQSLKAF